MSERSMKRDLLRLAPWLGAAVGLSVILTVAAVPSCAGPAPDFSAPLVSGPHQGDRLTRDSLAGEVVVLDFWASWCPPCVRSIPILNELADRYEGRVAFYGVNVESMTGERVADIHRELGARFPTLHDPDGRMKRAWAIQALPTLFVLDREGRIRHTERGIPDAEDLSEVLDGLLPASEGGPH
ncbi:MAG: hypothetical protein CMN30_29295 [Sandaracinus sp.]|nr:hypothetical protein [Sandaracinus sp.]